MKQEIFDIHNFDNYKEDNCREVKSAKGGLPQSLWETYSAFANSNGGVIILGACERADGSWFTTGLKKEDTRKLIKNFWNIINDSKKVSLNLLSEKDVEIYDVNEDVVLVIKVPMAPRQDKPIYLNGDLLGQAYRRNHEGDYRCTKAQVKGMLRDQPEITMDMNILEDIPMDYLNYETVNGYRNRHKYLKLGHPFEKLTDNEFLRSIGAAAISKEDGEYHPTGAGLLMFGDEYNILRHYPEYFLDYREMLDPTIRWTDRVHSSSGEWSGNVCDFYFRVYNKIIKEVKVPFKMIGGTRIDDTPVHKALREALANCLVNADFYEPRGVVIKLENHKLTIENPGYIRVGKKQILLGGISDPRNKGLMKMFNMIDIGERAGSGVSNIFNTWEDEGYEVPEIIEEFNPDRTKLILSFEKKAEEKSGRKKSAKKIGEKKSAKKIGELSISPKIMSKLEFLLGNMELGRWYKVSDLVDVLELKESRTRQLIGFLVDAGKIIEEGSTKGKRYQKKI